MRNTLSSHTWLLLSVLIVVVDLYTKHLASTLLVLHRPVNIMPFFDLTLIHNTGAAFGFLSSLEPTWETAFLAGVSIFAVILFYSWYRTSDQTMQRVAIALIIGGAIGNLIDRIRLGYVVDFLDFYVGEHHWPAFNVADMAITLGVLLIIISWVKHARHQ